MRIAITGGSGSLGRSLIQRLARDGADRIVTITRDEQKAIALEAAYSWHPHIRIFEGNILDRDRLVDAFAGCECVVHAAARKVVNARMDEPDAMHKVNVIGTRNVISAARLAGVRKVLFISSDKAVHACNVYGVSKALAEHLVISANARTWANNLRLGVLRYGNCLGSNGSVLRVWKEKAARGEALPVSDRRMTRFWLPLSDAVECVIKALADMRGGEVFVPWLKAAPLTRLLEAVAPGAAIEEIGIRPGGEKLHESLISEDEARRARRRNGWIIVPPADTPELWDRSPWLGTPVAPEFRYCSADWSEQWSVDELRELLEPVGDSRVEVRA